MIAIDVHSIAPRTFFLSERHRAERRYRRLIERVMIEAEKRFVDLDDPSAIIAALNSIVQSPLFDRMCREASSQIVTMLAVGQQSTWRQAAALSSRGRLIYNALMRETANSAIGQAIQNIVLENSALIKTVPKTIAERFSRLAQQRQFEGVRPADIAKEMLQKAPELREFEAKRIARTEAAKASTALVQARAESYGGQFYIWISVSDERTRPSHRMMDGVVCMWSDPPDPETLAGKKSYGSYHPGCIFNCRCHAAPVIAIEDIGFPARVYHAGAIVSVGSKKDLEGLSGLS